MDPAELARENEALNEQVKLLVKTERRLYAAQRMVEHKHRRLMALTNLATNAGRAGDPDVILALMLSTLVDELDADQAVTLVPTEAGARLAAMVTQPGWEPSDRLWRAPGFELPLVPRPQLLTSRAPSLSRRTAALLDVVDDYFAPAPGEGQRRVPAVELVVPLHGNSGKQLAVVVLRKLDLKTSIHETLLSEADLPFVELVVTRVEAFVENILLYRELEQFAAGLEQSVAARTAELSRANEALGDSLNRVRETQAQLVEAEKSAAMLTLVAGLSHELNNPVGVILGCAQGLLAETTGVGRHQLAAIERQARRCGLLVRALLEFAENRPVVVDSIPPALLLDGVVADAARAADERGVELVVDGVAADLPALTVNEENVREALGHLIDNALDATPAGGRVVLHARAHGRDGAPGVELSVRDTGAGIPHAFLSRIFDPFFTTKPPGQGVGLGLSLARRAIETNRGRIEVRSEIGHGTTVRVWLPVADVAPRAAEQHAPGAP